MGGRTHCTFALAYVLGPIIVFPNKDTVITVPIKDGSPQECGLAMPSYGGAQHAVTGPILAKLSAPALGDEKIKNVEFADDELIAGKVEKVIHAYKVVSATLAEDFGVVNSQLRVYMLNASDDDRTLVDEAGAELVNDGLTWFGTPIGKDEYVADATMTQADHLIELMDFQIKVASRDPRQGVQRVLQWMRLAIGPGFNHILRNVAPRLVEAAAFN